MLRITLIASLICCHAALAEVDEQARHEQLRREDLRSVRQYFLAKNEKLSRFWLGDKRLIDGTYSAMVLTAVDESAPPPFDPYFGVFIVYGKTNQTYMVLEISSEDHRCCGPKLETPTKNNVYVHWYSDYGFYSSSDKYEYDLLARRRGSHHKYKQFSVKGASKDKDGLVFSGTYGATDESLSLHRLENGQWMVEDVAKTEPDGAPSVKSIQITNGHRLEVSAKEIVVIDRKQRRQSYPAPVPSRDLYKRLRPETRTVSSAGDSFPGSIENEIGPIAFDGERLWFANTFYDGEGTSGLGAIGSFDVASRKYEMRYLPEIARWSASALLLDKGKLWIGLMGRPEGTPYGSGVLRFDTKTGATRTFPIKDYVLSIDRSSDLLYFGTSHGVYELDLPTDRIVHIRIEPGPSEKPGVIRYPVAEIRESERPHDARGARSSSDSPVAAAMRSARLSSTYSD